MEMIGKPDRGEAAEYHFGYIDKVPTEDLIGFLKTQAGEFVTALKSISEEGSLHRYEPGKWSLREALGHVNDTERIFAFRALWVARGGEPALPGFDQDVFAVNADSDARTWASLIEEFKLVRAATLALVEAFPSESWTRVGTVNNHAITTRVIGYLLAGHVEHHRQVIAARYV